MANRINLNQTSYHGAGAIEEIANEAKAHGFKKAFVCSDPDLVKFHVTSKVTDILEKNGLAYELYSDIKPNPTIENVQHGVQAFKDSEADLLDAQDDMQDISAFFKGAQKGIYDKAVLKVKFFSDDLSYINDNEKAKSALDTINTILAMPRPFSRIAELPSLTAILETEHSTLLKSKKNDSLSKIDAIKKELATYTKEYSKDIYNSYISKVDAEISYVEGANKIVAVAAENTKIDTIKDEAIAALLNAKPISVGPDPVDSVVEEPTDVDRNDLIQPRVLKTKLEVDAYINELKEKLYKYIPNGGVKIK